MAAPTAPAVATPGGAAGAGGVEVAGTPQNGPSASACTGKTLKGEKAYTLCSPATPLPSTPQKGTPGVPVKGGAGTPGVHKGCKAERGEKLHPLCPVGAAVPSTPGATASAAALAREAERSLALVTAAAEVHITPELALKVVPRNWAPAATVRAVHAHWAQKRRTTGMPLIRHFQVRSMCHYVCVSLCVCVTMCVCVTVCVCHCM